MGTAGSRLSGEFLLAARDTTTGPVPYPVDGDRLAITIAVPGGTSVELVCRAHDPDGGRRSARRRRT